MIGNVAGAFHGWPILLGRRRLHVVPAGVATHHVDEVVGTLGAEPAENGPDESRWWVLPSGAQLHATLAPSGTRGYADLVREAQSGQIAPGVPVQVASPIDLIRVAEASPDPDARMFVPALWATSSEADASRWKRRRRDLRVHQRPAVWTHYALDTSRTPAVSRHQSNDRNILSSSLSIG